MLNEVTNSKYADCLEMMCRVIIRDEPVAIAVNYIAESGAVGSANGTIREMMGENAATGALDDAAAAVSAAASAFRSFAGGDGG